MFNFDQDRSNCGKTIALIVCKESVFFHDLIKISGLMISISFKFIAFSIA